MVKLLLPVMGKLAAVNTTLAGCKVNVPVLILTLGVPARSCAVTK